MLEVLALGQFRLLRDGEDLDLGGARNRQLLAVLCAASGRPVGRSVLIEALWGTALPQHPEKALQISVSRLRRLLGPDAPAIGHRAGSYELDHSAVLSDVARFDAAINAAATAAADESLELLEAAYAMWRGEPYGGVPEMPLLMPETERLRRLRDTARLELLRVRLGVRGPSSVMADLEREVQRDPLGEGWTLLLARALYISGGQAEALRLLAGLRRQLSDEAGLEPSPAVIELETRILNHDPTLAARSSTSAGEREPVGPSPVSRATRTTDVLTFVFTDIENSTGLWLEDPETMNRALTRHDAILRTVFADHDGDIFAAGGDGLSVAFTTATAAVAAAADAQRQLQAEAWPNSVPLKVRIGLHSGTAYRRDNDYFGPALNQTARIMAAGYGLQTLMSDAVRELLGNDLPDEVTLRSLGEHNLKSIPEPVEILELQQQGVSSIDLPLRTETPAQSLPSIRTPIIGRDSLADELDGLLDRERLVTLVGPGGIGKSALALHGIHRAVPRFGDGAHYVPLSSVDDPDLVVDAIAQRIGLRVGHAGSLATLQEALVGRRTVILLDDVEHLLDAIATVVDSLLSQPGPTVMVTSRQRLDIEGEQVIPVGPLDEVDPSGVSAAARLLVRSAGGRGRLIPSDREAMADVESLCSRLDHLPLAIELAAAAAPLFSAAELQRELDQGFRLEVKERPGRRWTTLEEMVAWSYRLLEPREQGLLRSLAVGREPMDADLIHAIWAPESNRDELDRRLALLVSASLVVVDQSSRTSTYRLLDSVRHFAQAEAAELGEWDNIRARHRDWCLRWVEAATPHERYVSAPRALTLRSRLADLGASMAFSAERGELDLVSRQARAMSGTWSVLSRGAEGLRWLELSRDGPKDAYGQLAHAVAEISAAMACQRWEEFFEAMGRAHSLAEGQPDHDVLPLLHGLTGLSKLTDPDEGLAIFKNALELDRRLGTSWASLLRHLAGELLVFAGRYSDCVRWFNDALALYRWQNDPWWTSSALTHLAVAHLALGDIEQAIEDARASVDVERNIPTEVAGRSGVNILGAALTVRGMVPEAASLMIEECRRLSGQPARPEHQAEPFATVALLAATAGATKPAIQLVEVLQTLGFHRRTPWQRFIWTMARDACDERQPGRFAPLQTVAEGTDTAVQFLRSVELEPDDSAVAADGSD